jgi:hypothetical protein
MNKLQTKIIRNDSSFLCTSLGDEAVMMNLTTGDFIGLNPVAANIWKLIKDPISIASLIKKLTEKYEVNEIVCTAETMVYLAKMTNERMLLEVRD